MVIIVAAALAAALAMHEIVIEVVVVTWMVVDIIVREDMLPIFAAPEVEDIPTDMDVAEEMRHLAAAT